MESKDKEREIDLRQLIVLVMMRWRIIVWMVFICMALGIFFATQKNKDHQTIRKEIGYSEDQLYNYKLSLYKEMKIYYESEIKKFLEGAEKEKVYIENSLRMKVDPLNQMVGTAYVHINSAIESSGPVVRYQELMRSEVFWHPLSEKYSIEPKYFREMCTIELNEQSPDKRKVVQLTAIMPDKKMAEEALALLLGMFDQKNTKLLQKYVYVRIDPDLAQFQREMYSQLAQRYDELQNMYNSYDRLVEPRKKARVDARKAGDGSDKRVLLKGAIFGGLAGVCGAAMLIALSLILSGRLLSYSEFFDRYPLNCLTVFPPEPTRRHMLALDRRLLQWRDNSRFSRLDRTERFDIAVEKIRLHIKEGESVLLLGTIALSRIQEVQVALAERLVSCTIEAWRFVDQQLATLHEIDQYEYIVLIEEVGISKFQDIDNEMQMLHEHNKKIVGCIVM